jgi:UDP-N-acetylglucosamine--N-acetylmuramyl-(pentapeptide) pyrophosphoryl-undecaprenol N-acetylglucosamine transferase
MLPDAELSGQRLLAELQSLLAEPERLASMARASRSLGRPNAADAVLDAVREMIGEPVARPATGRARGEKRGAA